MRDDERAVVDGRRREGVSGHAARETLAVAAGGALGAALRVVLADSLPLGGWPWPTFVANLAGVALLAYAATRLQERLAPSVYRRPFAAAGLCGALTTFSTFQVEAIRLSRDGRAGLAVLYVVTSVAVGAVVMVGVTNLVRRAELGR